MDYMKLAGLILLCSLNLFLLSERHEEYVRVGRLEERLMNYENNTWQFASGCCNCPNRPPVITTGGMR